MSLSEQAIANGEVAEIATFFLTSKGGDAGAATSLLREVLSILDPSDVAQPRKKQRSEPSFAAGSDQYRETSLEVLDLSYFANTEADTKPGTVVMLVPNQQHLLGAIIGKSGSNMNYVQQHSGSRVQLEKKSGQTSATSEITITGTIRNNNVACSLLFDKVSQYLRSKDQAADPFATSLKIIVPSQAVRLLIGKGGSIINELQKTSQAHIQFQNESETAPGSFGRTVTIKADDHTAVQKAEYLISLRMAEDEKYDPSWAQNLRKNQNFGTQNSPQSPYTQSQSAMPPIPSSVQPSYAQNMSYDQMMTQQLQQQQQELQQAMMQLQQQQQAPGQSSTGMSAYGYAPPPSAYAPPSSGYAPPSSGYAPPSSGYAPPPYAPPSAPSGMGGMSTLSAMGGMGGGETTVEVAVPNVWVSRLIGRSGSHITEMQNKTGARIQIQKEKEMAPGATSRKVTISGSASAVGAAQQLLNTNVAVLEAQERTK